jgi:predicted permease
MDLLMQDVAFAARTLRKTPGFTIIVVLTLALGIGANTAIFSLTDQVLLRRLPVQHPEQLVVLDGPGPNQGRTFNNGTFSYPMYCDFRDHNTVMDGVIARFPAPLTLTINGQAERVAGELVSGNFFDVLGVRPLVGRLFRPDDDKTPGGHPIAILAYDYWMRRFAGDPRVLNQKIALNSMPMTIVGVAPRDFHGVILGEAPDVMVPLMMKAQMTPTWDDLMNRRSRWVTIMARVKPGLSHQQAEASMNVLYRQINQDELKQIATASKLFRERFVAKHLFLREGAKGRSDIRDQFSTPILVLMGMVGLVLLIACANVANLLLARGAARQKEVAIRMALGAGRRAIVRQRLIESLLLGAGGAVLGIMLAWWTGALLIKALPFDSAGTVLSASPDGRIVAFALVTAFVTALLFGLAPALQSTRPVLTTTLKDEAGSVVGGTGHSRFRKALVVAQVGLSVLLLAGAALFARSLYNLKTLNPGFQADQLLGFSIDPSLSGYSKERAIAIYQQLQDRLAQLPEVHAATASVLPIMADDNWSSTVRVEGYQPKEGEDMNPDVDAVGPDYFSTMGQPLIAGREFTIKDGATAPKVAVINETMARTYFGKDSPLGRHLGWNRDKTTNIEIVGVVKDAKMSTLRDQIRRYVYTPYMQEAELGSMTFYVRARGAADSTAASVRAAALRVDPNLPIFDMKTMTQTMDDSLFIERMVAALSTVFGALATLLAALGLYGVMSYSVARRTREIGIRMALGAERQSVMWMVLREVTVMVAIGVAIGLPLAFGLSQVVRSQLFDLSPHDPVALAASAGILASVALLAGYFPARRATRVDPMLALRYE